MVFATIAKRGITFLLLDVLLFIYLKVALSTDSSDELYILLSSSRVFLFIYLEICPGYTLWLKPVVHIHSLCNTPKYENKITSASISSPHSRLMLVNLTALLCLEIS